MFETRKTHPAGSLCYLGHAFVVTADFPIGCPEEAYQFLCNEAVYLRDKGVAIRHFVYSSSFASFELLLTLQ